MPKFDKLAKHWDIYTYPWRPNYDFINILKSSFFDMENILILWSTKEFREIFKNREITICDLSKKMYLENFVWNNREIFINRNWFNLNNFEKYDLILWDLILLMFDFDYKIKLINLLIDKLSEKWGIILRLVVRKENNNKINDLFKFFNWNKNMNLFFNYITFELVNWKLFKAQDIYSVLFDKSELVSKFFLKTFYNLTPYNSWGNFCLNQEQFNILFKKFNFNILLKNDFLFVDEYVVVIKKRY